MEAWPWLAHTQYEFAVALRHSAGAGDRTRVDGLLAAAAQTAERLSMPSLGKQIRGLAH